MKRLALALAFLAAGCHHGKKPTTGEPIIAKKIQLSWGLSPNGGGTDVFLQTTDETGAQVSHSLGTQPGACTATKPPAEMGSITGLSCTGGIELYVNVRPNNEIIVSSLKVQAGVPPDPMSRNELTRFSAPAGAGVEGPP